jgi:hypothetical protein
VKHIFLFIYPIPVTIYAPNGVPNMPQDKSAQVNFEANLSIFKLIVIFNWKSVKISH